MARIGRWDFTQIDPAASRADLEGSWDHLELWGLAGDSPHGLALASQAGAEARGFSGKLKARTLVAWVRLTRTGDPLPGRGWAIRLHDTGDDQHDALCWRGIEGRYRWYTTSERDLRSVQGPEDGDAGWGRAVQVAATYSPADDDTEVVLYVDGVEVGRHRSGRRLGVLHRPVVSFGADRQDPKTYIPGAILGAEVHDEVLDVAALAALEPPEALLRPAAGPTFALVIGIEENIFLDAALGRPLGSAALRNARNDVRSMAMFIRLMGVPAANVRVLATPHLGADAFDGVALGRGRPIDMNLADATFGRATKAEILAGLDWLRAQLMAHPGSQGVVYYAGHSVTTTAGHPALVPMDATTREDGEVDASVAEPSALARFRDRARVAHGLAAMLGTTDPEAIAAFVASAQVRPGLLTAKALVSAVADHGQPTPDQAEILRTFLRSGGSQEVAQLFRRVLIWGFGPDEIAAALRDDPLAADGDLDGLISYARAFDAAFHMLPDDRSLTVVLESCLPASDGREPQAAYQEGMPLPHDQCVMLAGCALGENSWSAVFDNEWHGVFTWSLVATLSQRSVLVTPWGRCFDLSYAELEARVDGLVQALGLDVQDPTLWGRPPARAWPVFGREGWAETVLETLPPSRRREEVSPGADGHLYEVKDLGELIGWLVVTNAGFTVGSESWSANHDYWLMEPGKDLPTGTNDSVTLTKKNSGSLKTAIQSLGIVRSDFDVRDASSQDFSGSSTTSASFQGYYEVLAGTTVVGYLKWSSTSITWYRKSSVTADRLDLGSSGSLVRRSSGQVSYRGSPIQH